MNYTQTLDWIHSFKANGRRPSLERMRYLLTLLDNPQDTFPAIHNRSNDFGNGHQSLIIDSFSINSNAFIEARDKWGCEGSCVVARSR